MKTRMYLAFIAVALGGAQAARAQMVDVDADGAILEAKVKAVPDQVSKKVTGSVQEQLSGLAKVRNAADAQAKACVEARREMFAEKYAIAFDANQKPCRIYDLSFPTLLGGRQKVTSVPTRKPTARDYLNWINGKTDEVEHAMTAPTSLGTSAGAIPDGWVQDLRFRATPNGLKAQATRDDGMLPASFSAADLDVGDFRFTAAERMQLKQVFSEAKALSGAPMTTFSAEDQAWQALADKPESLLQKIKFNRDDVRKVYDIILEGEFLPIRGPVTMVDFERPYKGAVENMVRSITASMFRSLARAIPEPTTRALVDVAVTDIFEFMDMMYTYQGNQFEEAARAGLDGRVKSILPSADLDRALNIYFGARSDLLSQYILAAAQGKPFVWDDMAKLGATTRYTVEKTRDIQLRTANSRLVLKKGCEVTRPYPYFGVCSKDGKKDAMYSLMSEQTVLFWNLGAPMVHRFDRPQEVFGKRMMSWILSVAARLFTAPYLGRGLSDKLSNELKGFAKAGLADEAFLRERLSLDKKQAGKLPGESDTLLNWMYMQNINPFMPKSADAEAKLIGRNASAVNNLNNGMQAGDLQ